MLNTNNIHIYIYYWVLNGYLISNAAKTQAMFNNLKTGNRCQKRLDQNVEGWRRHGMPEIRRGENQGRQF